MNAIQVVENNKVISHDTLENLTNYIFSVQSLVDRIHIMKEEIPNYEYINKRVIALENFEDKVLLDLAVIK